MTFRDLYDILNALPHIQNNIRVFFNFVVIQMKAVHAKTSMSALRSSITVTNLLSAPIQMAPSTVLAHSGSTETELTVLRSMSVSKPSARAQKSINKACYIKM